MKRRVAELEAREPERLEVPVLTDADREALRTNAQAAREAAITLVDTAERVLSAIARAGVPIPARREPVAQPQRPEPTRTAPARRDMARRAEMPRLLGKGELATLKTTAQYPNGVTREQLTVMTGYKRSSRDAYIQRLRAAAYVETDGGMERRFRFGVAKVPGFEVEAPSEVQHR